MAGESSADMKESHAMAGESSADMKESHAMAGESIADFMESEEFKEYEKKHDKNWEYVDMDVTKCAHGFRIEVMGILVDGEKFTWVAAKNIVSAALQANQNKLVLTTPTFVFMDNPELDKAASRVYKAKQIKQILEQFRADLAAAGYEPQEYEKLIYTDHLVF